jgi:hypothetical protein
MFFLREKSDNVAFDRSYRVTSILGTNATSVNVIF